MKFRFTQLSSNAIISVILLIIVTGTVYFKTVSFDYLLCDDIIHVFENPHVIPGDISKVSIFWKDHYKGLYIPMTYSVWILGSAVLKIIPPAEILKPAVFHLISIMIHIINVTLVFFILLRITRKNIPSMLGAMLFSLHPIQVEAVAWISELKGLLATFFSLISILLFLIYATTEEGHVQWRNRRIYYLISVIAFILALLSKPSAVVTPLIISILLWGACNRKAIQLTKELSLWFVIIIPFAVLTVVAQPDNMISNIPPPDARILVAGDALSFYAYKLLAPFNLTVDYGRFPQYIFYHKWVLLTGLIPFVVITAIVGLYRKKWLLTPAGIFIVSLLPVLGLIPFVYQNVSTVSDRYIYLGMLGPSLAVAWFLSKADKKVLNVLTLIVMILLGILSYMQLDIWENTKTLFIHNLKINPRSEMSYLNLAVYSEKENNLKDAAIYYEKALSNSGGYLRGSSNYVTKSNLAMVLYKLGNFEESRYYFFRALLDTKYKFAPYKNLAMVSYTMGYNNATLYYSKKALEYNPGDNELRYLVEQLQGKGSMYPELKQNK